MLIALYRLAATSNCGHSTRTSDILRHRDFSLMISKDMVYPWFQPVSLHIEEGDNNPGIQIVVLIFPQTRPWGFHAYPHRFHNWDTPNRNQSLGLGPES